RTLPGADADRGRAPARAVYQAAGACPGGSRAAARHLRLPEATREYGRGRELHVCPHVRLGRGRGACPRRPRADHDPAARCGARARVGPGDPVPRPRTPRVPPPRHLRAEAPAPARRGRCVDAAEGGVTGVLVCVVGLLAGLLVAAWADRRRLEAVQARDAEIGRDTSELQSRENLVCRLLLEKKKTK